MGICLGLAYVAGKSPPLGVNSNIMINKSFLFLYSYFHVYILVFSIIC